MNQTKRCGKVHNFAADLSCLEFGLVWFQFCYVICLNSEVYVSDGLTVCYSGHRLTLFNRKSTRASHVIQMTRK